MSLLHQDLYILHLQNSVIYSASFKPSLNSAVKSPLVPVSSHNFLLHTCTFFLHGFFFFFSFWSDFSNNLSYLFSDIVDLYFSLLLRFD